MVESGDNHLVEVALRDLANIDVILATDRLVRLPENAEQMRTALTDLELVKEFVLKRTPEALKEPAKQVFMAHVEVLRQHFRSLSEARQ